MVNTDSIVHIRAAQRMDRVAKGKGKNKSNKQRQNYQHPTAALWSRLDELHKISKLVGESGLKPLPF